MLSGILFNENVVYFSINIYNFLLTQEFVSCCPVFI